MTPTALIAAYEQSLAAHRATRTTATWRAAANAEYALFDWLKWHGPVIHGGTVYAADNGELVVIHGVRTAAEIEAEPKGAGE